MTSPIVMTSRLREEHKDFLYRNTLLNGLMYSKEPSAWEYRSSIFEAQNWRCCYCGVRMFAGEPQEDMLLAGRRMGVRYFWRTGKPYNTNGVVLLRRRRATIEHLHRRADGGSHDRDNLVGACQYCNSGRGHHDPIIWFEEIQRQIRDGEHPHGIECTTTA